MCFSKTSEKIVECKNNFSLDFEETSCIVEFPENCEECAQVIPTTCHKCDNKFTLVDGDCKETFCIEMNE